MLPAGFEPAIPSNHRPQTQALDRAATGIGIIGIWRVRISTGTPPIMTVVFRAFAESL